jgi:hypothetical protein
MQILNCRRRSPLSSPPSQRLECRLDTELESAVAAQVLTTVSTPGLGWMIAAGRVEI